MLIWEQKKVIIYLFSIVGSFRNKEFWKYFMLFPKDLEHINKIIHHSEQLLISMQMHEKEYDVLMRDIKKGVYKIECLHNREFEDRRKQARKQPVTVREEDLHALVEHAMDNYCNNCTRNPKACALRKTLKRLSIIEVDPDKVDGCEFCIKKGDKR